MIAALTHHLDDRDHIHYLRMNECCYYCSTLSYYTIAVWWMTMEEYKVTTTNGEVRERKRSQARRKHIAPQSPKSTARSIEAP